MPDFIDQTPQPEMLYPEDEFILEDLQDEEDLPQEINPVDQLSAFLRMTNVAEEIDDDTLKEMGKKAVEDYKLDKDSLSEWEKTIEGAMSLAKLTQETKESPAGDTVSNVKYPALATASIQFSARALPNIIKGRDVVKGKVIGLSTPPELKPEDSEEDAEGVLFEQQTAVSKWAKADRIASFMSYQFMDEMDDWVDDVDQLLMSLPVVGCAFKKTYYDFLEGKPCSPYVSVNDLVVNYHAKSLRTASRITHVLELSPNDIEERVRGEMFLDVELNDPEPTEEKDAQDEDATHTFLEQHRWWDVDGDGYKEPYIVTVHKESEQVVRVVPRWDADGVVVNDKGQIIKIKPVHYFTRFLFMPSFDGSLYGMGLGSLMLHMNETINSIINQLVDAGSLANSQSGLVGKGVTLGKNGVFYVKRNTWKHVNFTGDDIRKALVPLPTPDPSPVLFQLLDFLIGAAKEVSSVADVLTGEQQGANASPTTTLALIEQGLKVFSSIYKRLHRSFKSEYRKVRRLNSLYLDEEHYIKVLDDPEAQISDFKTTDIDVVPVSDETELTHIQKLIKAEALNAMKGQGLNDLEIDRRYLEAMDTPDPEKILPPENYEPPEDPEVIIKRDELEVKRVEAMNDQERVRIERDLADAKIRKTEVEMERSMGTIREMEAKALTDEHMEKLDSLTKVVSMISDALKGLTDRVVGEKKDAA